MTGVQAAHTYEEEIKKFKQLIKLLDPDLTEICFHSPVETEKLKGIKFAWQQHVWEAEIFSNPDLINFFEYEEIIFNNWKEIMKRFKK